MNCSCANRRFCWSASNVVRFLLVKKGRSLINHSAIQFGWYVTFALKTIPLFGPSEALLVNIHLASFENSMKYGFFCDSRSRTESRDLTVVWTNSHKIDSCCFKTIFKATSVCLTQIGTNEMQIWSSLFLFVQLYVHYWKAK